MVEKVEVEVGGGGEVMVEVERAVKKEHLARRQRVYGGHARRGVHERHLAEERVGGGGAVALVLPVSVEQRQLHLVRGRGRGSVRVRVRVRLRVRVRVGLG